MSIQYIISDPVTFQMLFGEKIKLLTIYYTHKDRKKFVKKTNPYIIKVYNNLISY